MYYICTDSLNTDGTNTNEPLGNVEHKNQLKKRRYRHAQDSELRSNLFTFANCARGARLCSKELATLSDLTKHTICKHATTLSTDPEFLLYKTKLNQSVPEKLRSYRHIVDGFLSYISNRCEVDCPTGRGSDEGRHVMFIPSDIKNVEVYNDYCGSFKELQNAVKINDHGILQNPLTYSAFIR